MTRGASRRTTLPLTFRCRTSLGGVQDAERGAFGRSVGASLSPIETAERASQCVEHPQIRRHDACCSKTKKDTCQWPNDIPCLERISHKGPSEPKRGKNLGFSIMSRTKMPSLKTSGRDFHATQSLDATIVLAMPGVSPRRFEPALSRPWRRAGQLF